MGIIDEIKNSEVTCVPAPKDLTCPSDLLNEFFKISKKTRQPKCYTYMTTYGVKWIMQCVRIPRKMKKKLKKEGRYPVEL